MGFWIFMLVMNSLIPLTMIGFGSSFMKNAPKEINLAFGYRSKMSIKNRETWEFAHYYCGKIWRNAGWVLLAFSLIVMPFLLGKSVDTIGTFGSIVCFIEVLFLAGAIVPTEIALKKNFDNNGNRK